MNGITIIDAHASAAGDFYATFEICTNAYGGFERYRVQDGYSTAALWRVSDGIGVLMALGDDVAPAMTELLRRVHAMEPCKLTYREFQILVDGWVAGRKATPNR